MIAIIWMLKQSFLMLSAQQEQKHRIMYLDNLPLLDLDSNRYSFSPKRIPTILILAQTTCEHCENQLRELRRSERLISQTDVVIVSVEAIRTIKAFSGMHTMPQQKQTTFCKLNPENLHDFFGNVAYPRILVYGEDRKLRKEFVGETKAELILEWIP